MTTPSPLADLARENRKTALLAAKLFKHDNVVRLSRKAKPTRRPVFPGDLGMRQVLPYRTNAFLSALAA
ncbi:hypothetical protein FHY55_10680 [Oceanicola sp. D3]|uniref:hypothetical protein n=1 Tax=Oceanicola sp. D3 TaxID=2587163 RepID=UPI0011226F81|nr:hypothetical protein [Oceanicola sp. D3]QDC09681.1 hypothetical protein FHY55_10680 [Oceanicola sp. D3]